jgi:hypothetical protein
MRIKIGVKESLNGDLQDLFLAYNGEIDEWKRASKCPFLYKTMLKWI